MKPGDHPDFYRLAPPPGASRDQSDPWSSWG